MLKFTKAGSVKRLSNTRFWEVCEPFIWRLVYGLESPGDIVVPGGFKTDFGSIPRIFWSIIDPTEWNAYVLHDYLYSTHYENRDNCDRILAEALVAEGCSRVVALVVYLALFLFGEKAWNSYNIPTDSNSLSE